MDCATFQCQAEVLLTSFLLNTVIPTFLTCIFPNQNNFTLYLSGAEQFVLGKARQAREKGRGEKRRGKEKRGEEKEKYFIPYNL